MSSLLAIKSNELSDERLQVIARELCQILNRDSGINAKFEEQDSTNLGARGDIIALGNIILTILSSETIAVLFEIIKSYIDRDSSISFVLEANDEKFEFSAKNMSGKEANEVLSHLSKIVGLQKQELEK